MNLLKRLVYYGGGFAAGIIIVFFFLNGKKTSCDYSPKARVLKNIGLKKRVFTANAMNQFKKHSIDTADFGLFLKKGTVDFGKSNTKLDSCKTYWIEGAITDLKKIAVLAENCTHNATILEVHELE